MTANKTQEESLLSELQKHLRLSVTAIAENMEITRKKATALVESMVTQGHPILVNDGIVRWAGEGNFEIRSHRYKARREGGRK